VREVNTLHITRAVFTITCIARRKGLLVFEGEGGDMRLVGPAKRAVIEEREEEDEDKALPQEIAEGKGFSPPWAACFVMPES
jgi:hypothetical protein